MEMLKTFVLKLEPFAGTNLEEVAREMCVLANRIGVRCEVSANGVKFWARPGDSPTRIFESYEEQLKSNHQFKIAQDTEPMGRTTSGG
jgi:hypothetical protein